jgi:hypothetical protein
MGADASPRPYTQLISVHADKRYVFNLNICALFWLLRLIKVH